MLTQDGLTRAQVLAMRIQLERLARDAFDDCCATTRAPGDHGQASTRRRLIYLLAPVAGDPERLARAHGVVRLASFVYEQTSSVLHGRMSLLSITPQLLQEWQSALRELEDLRALGGAAAEASLANAPTTPTDPVLDLTQKGDAVVDLTRTTQPTPAEGFS